MDEVVFDVMEFFADTKYKAMQEADGSFSIASVPIFELGTHRKKNYDEKWFEATKAVHDTFEKEKEYLPTIIKGHTKDDDKEERPAVGRFRNLALKGKQVLADFVNIPAEMMEEIKKGFFPYRSIEVSHEGNFIAAIALLGGTTPQIKLPRLAVQFANQFGSDCETDVVLFEAAALDATITQVLAGRQVRRQLNEQEDELWTINRTAQQLIQKTLICPEIDEAVRVARVAEIQAEWIALSSACISKITEASKKVVAANAALTEGVYQMETVDIAKFNELMTGFNEMKSVVATLQGSVVSLGTENATLKTEIAGEREARQNFDAIQRQGTLEKFGVELKTGAVSGLVDPKTNIRYAVAPGLVDQIPFKALSELSGASIVKFAAADGKEVELPLATRVLDLFHDMARMAVAGTLLVPTTMTPTDTSVRLVGGPILPSGSVPDTGKTRGQIILDKMQSLAVADGTTYDAVKGKGHQALVALRTRAEALIVSEITKSA